MSLVRAEVPILNQPLVSKKITTQKGMRYGRILAEKA